MKRKHIIPSITCLLSLLTIILLASPELQNRTIVGFETESGLSLPATGVWNGFLDHMVVAEFNNLDSSPANLEYVLKNSKNEEIGSENIQIAANSTQHVILNKFPITDDYGTITIKSTNRNLNPQVSCFVVTYKMQGDKNVQYATNMPVKSPVYGPTIGVYNSMNPDSTQTNPVYNWLSIFNPGFQDFSAKVVVRNQNGEIMPEALIKIDNLAPGGRIDTALGHPLGQVVGSYEILPEDPEAPYGAFLSRYSKTQDGSFNFSMSIPASDGYTDSGLVPASTMGKAFNWGEIANFSNYAKNVLIQVFNREGEVLLNEEVNLPAYSQKHIFLNNQLGEENVGYFRVQSLGEDSPGRIVVQSLFYGHDDISSSNITWAYITPGSGGEYVSEASYPINTNLGAPNWLKLFNPNENPINIALEIYSQNGEKIDLGSGGKFTLNGSLDIPIHTLAGSNKVGLVRVYSTS